MDASKGVDEKILKSQNEYRLLNDEVMTEAQQRIKQLVKYFKEQEAAYLSPGYQESQLRQDFLDKFFAALGWDVTHELQKNPYEQEVKIENKVNAGRSQRRADFAFFIAPNFRDVKFFVEAKKPSRNLANPVDYYQTIRYGWNSKTPIAVLTDFEEFHILDCRFKPDIKTALDRKIEAFHYTDYEDEEKFKRIYYLFNHDDVANGSIEKFAANLPKPRAKTARKGMFKVEYKPVDESFLEVLDEYRDTLARAFKRANQQLEGEELTEAVQRTIDRLVFIRFLEDKMIEEPHIIGLKEKSSVWNGFLSLCKSLEPKYNGLVFKNHKIIDCTAFNPPDEKIFANICEELSSPTSPYDFDKIPISILGSIYERFLGKVVSTTEKRAKVIEKPEVRKAGGVYYTPEYIVRYIVNETIGKLLYEKKGIGFSNEGVGSNNKSIGGESYDTTNVQGIGSVEAGDVVGGGNLQTDSPPISQCGLSQRGTIRIEEPNAAFGCLNSGEHSRGIRAGESEGIPAFPIVFAGIADGRSRESHSIPQTTLNPNAYSLNPNAYTLNPNAYSLNPNAYTLNPNAYSLIPKVTPEQVAKMAFADIACGSGSFLIEVYTQLLDYHTKYYLDHPEQAKKGDIETREGKTVLSLKKRQEILTNNIYGVDIDFQATEVTQLSLYLKLLEDVTMNDAFQYSLLKEKILPDLRNNIVCGNSLIGTDILEGKLFDSKEERKLNPMNFEDAFPKVMQKGGFDAVVGNPPYRKERDSIEFIADLKRSKFGKQYYEGKMNLWYFFLHRAIELTKKGGFISFIVSSYWLKGSGARKLIQHVKAECSFVDTVEFAKNKIFDKVSGQHMIFTVIRDKKNQKVKCQRFTSEGLHPNEIARVLTEKSAKQSQVYSVDEVQVYTIDGKINFGLGPYLYILSHLEKSSFQLENGSGSFEVSQGIVEAPDSISRAVAEYANQPELAGEGVFVLSKREIKKIRFNEREKLFIKRYLHAADVNRYHWQFSGYFVFYIGNKENKQIDRARWLYPNISRHLDRYKGFITSSNRPYGIHRTRESRFFASEKLLCPNMFDRPNFAYCVDEYYVNFAFNVIISGQTSYSLKYLLGLLNSKLGAFWFNINGKKRGINNDVGVAVMRQFPVHRINFSNLAEIDWHDNIVNLVEQMLSAKQRAAAAKTDAEINKLELQIDSLDRKIDEAVYELYGLTEEEIRTVEGDGG